MAKPTNDMRARQLDVPFADYYLTLTAAAAAAVETVVAEAN